MTGLGDGVFKDWKGDERKLNIPDSITRIGASAFENCSDFSGLTMGEYVTEIGESAFKGCSGFKGSLNLPNRLTTIGAYAFDGCSGFTSKVEIGSGVTYIGTNAFNQCSGLELIRIPKHAVVGENAFNTGSQNTETEYYLVVVFYNDKDTEGEYGIIQTGQITYGTSLDNFMLSLSDERNGKKFYGWYNQEFGGDKIEADTVLWEDQKLYSRYCYEGIWNVDIKDAEYCGKNIIPELYVYDNGVLLQKNTDYTVSYKNNVKAYTLSEKAPGFDSRYAPTITITGKGNYTGKETVYFKIQPADISSDTFAAEAINLKTTNKPQKPVPKLLWNGKVLGANGNYSIKYYRADSQGKASGYPLDNVVEEGNYVIRLEGLGKNFVGIKDVPLTLTKDRILVSRLSVAKIKDMVYDSHEITPEIVVKYGKETLKAGYDYSISYSDNVQAGKACATITGIGNYIGTRKVYFNILATPITKTNIRGIEKTVSFTGNDITFNKLSVLDNTGKELSKNVDYLIEYTKNVNVGTGTVIISGINNYSGTIKKTFRITPYDLSTDQSRVTVSLQSDSFEYTKGGVKPVVTVKFENGDKTSRTLVEKTDYTVSYQKNTAANDGSVANKTPTVKVTLKGNYKGSITKTFKIDKKDINNVNITVNDKTYQKKANVYASGVTLTDTDGKKLVAGVDYDKAIVYKYYDNTIVMNGESVVTRNLGTIIDKKDIIPERTTIKVVVYAKDGGNYTGVKEGEYKITRSSIAAASVKVPAQEYNGAPITINENEMTVKVGKDILTSSDFEIVPGSYVNNVNKGTASFTIKGIGNYGGTKKVTFSIKSKVFKWWWK